MPDSRTRADGARVLADLNALRGIGAYKTGVHKPTFSEPHRARWSGWPGSFPRPGSPPRSTASAMCSAPARKPGAKLLAGSHLESQNFAGWLDGPLGVVYALEAARVINSDPDVKGAVEVAAWCDEEGHFGCFLGSRSYVGGVTEADIDAARDRTSGRTMREALRDVGLAGRPRVSAEPRAAYRISGGAYRAGPDARNRRSRHRRRHLHRRDLAIPDQLHRRAKSRRHHPHGRSQGRRPGAGQVLRRYRRSVPRAVRTAHGVDHRPHHARSRCAEHHPGTRRNAVSDSRR